VGRAGLAMNNVAIVSTEVAVKGENYMLRFKGRRNW
jgi:hypothetical protein